MSALGSYWICPQCSCDVRYGSHHRIQGCYPAGPRLQDRFVWVPPQDWVPPLAPGQVLGGAS